MLLQMVVCKKTEMQRDTIMFTSLSINKRPLLLLLPLQLLCAFLTGCNPPGCYSGQPTNSVKV